MVFDPNKLNVSEGGDSQYDKWKEVEDVRKEHGGSTYAPQRPDLRGAMSHEELVSWQGENGDRYRGMAPSVGPDLRGAMSYEELVSWQGENGEYNRAGHYASEAEMTAARREQMGTENPDVARIVNAASQFNYNDKASAENILNALGDETDAMQKIVEKRVKRTFAGFENNSAFNESQALTDLAFIEGMVDRGFDLDETMVDTNFYLGGDEEMMSLNQVFDKMADRYNELGARMKDPDDPKKEIDAVEYIARIREKNLREDETEKTGEVKRKLSDGEIIQKMLELRNDREEDLSDWLNRENKGYGLSADAIMDWNRYESEEAWVIGMENELERLERQDALLVEALADMNSAKNEGRKIDEIMKEKAGKFAKYYDEKEDKLTIKQKDILKNKIYDLKFLADLIADLREKDF